MGLNCPWYPEWLWHSFLAVPQAAVQRSVTIGPLRRGWRFSIPLLTQPLGWECWNSDALDSVWLGTPLVCLARRRSIAVPYCYQAMIWIDAIA